jgi:hypothetical protein
MLLQDAVRTSQLAAWCVYHCVFSRVDDDCGEMSTGDLPEMPLILLASFSATAAVTAQQVLTQLGLIKRTF